ncbi:hypothetical protein [Tritonibacter mobilis]|uniref:hypothetical protein n=1 Tax=Tritonibacter mobilis TaxID=379347 RepID=UPI0039A69871
MAQLVFGAGLMLMGGGLTLVALLSLQDNVEKAIKGNSERPRAVQLRFLHPGYFVGAFNEFDVSGWFAGLAGSYDVDKGTRSYAVFSAFPLSKEGPHLIAIQRNHNIGSYLSTLMHGKRELPAYVRIHGFADYGDIDARRIKNDLRRKGHDLQGKIYYAEVFTDRRGRAVVWLWIGEIVFLGFSVGMVFLGFVLIRSERESLR